MKKILAVASSGGHWIQLLRLEPAFEGLNLVYATTSRIDPSEFKHKVHLVTDAHLSFNVKLIVLFFQILKILIIERPSFIVSTGAAPGLIAIMLGKIFFIKTVWIDSIANSEELSLSGKVAKYFATVWLTQWPHLESNDGPDFWGNVL
jgi:UDP-N-acetylglucosamine:LPS N-acetylglucosamine transferase